MANDFIVVEGLQEFIEDLRRAPARVQRAGREALKAGGRRIVTRAAAYAPRRSGRMAADVTVSATTRGVTATWRQPYSAVQEWATEYVRGGPRGGPVHMTGPEPPRFAHKAANELMPSIGEDLLDEVARAAAAGGWFEVSG